MPSSLITRPAELFKKCVEQEARLVARSYEQVYFNSLIKHLLYHRPPIFWPDRMPSFENEMGKDTLPFTFSVAQTVGDTRSVKEWKYDTILKLLKDEPDRLRRLHLVARWLNQENVCAPEDFLPPEILQTMLKFGRNTFDLSRRQLSTWALVKSWKRYFILLFRDLKKAQLSVKDVSAQLKNEGYDAEAIKCALGKRSAQSAAIFWTHLRTKRSLHSIQNDFTHGRRPTKARRNK
jgi:hypothetical protein